MWRTPCGSTAAPRGLAMRPDVLSCPVPPAEVALAPAEGRASAIATAAMVRAVCTRVREISRVKFACVARSMRDCMTGSWNDFHHWARSINGWDSSGRVASEATVETSGADGVAKDGGTDRFGC